MTREDYRYLITLEMLRVGAYKSNSAAEIVAFVEALVNYICPKEESSAEPS